MRIERAKVGEPAQALAAMLIADAIYLFDALGIPPLPAGARAEVQAVALGLLQASGPASASGTRSKVSAANAHELQPE